MRWTTGAWPPSGCGFLLIVVLLGSQNRLIMTGGVPVCRLTITS
ncbi:hypothetical protein V6U90_02240 [Micromonospora sp. CPCC 206060]